MEEPATAQSRRRTLAITLGGVLLVIGVLSVKPIASLFLAAPLIIWLGYQYPFERSRLLRTIALHLIACAALTVLLWIASDKLAPAVEPAVAADDLPLWIDEAAPWDSSVFPPSHVVGYGGPPPPARLLFAALVYAVLTSIGQGTAWYQRARQRERRALIAEGQLNKARLAALQMQINPHFLFNTLNSISTLIHTDPRAAEDMLTDLSDLLRGVLDTADLPQISLAREFDFLDAYLSIEQRRFGQRLTVERDVEQHALKCAVPTLILQPLVENAIKHGIESQRAPGTIRLTAKQLRDQLIVEVSDSGPGLKHLLAHTDSQSGIGLNNTRSRLEHSFGDAHGFSIRTSDLGGCAVEVRIPFTTMDGGDEL